METIFLSSICEAWFEFHPFENLLSEYLYTIDKPKVHAASNTTEGKWKFFCMLLNIKNTARVKILVPLKWTEISGLNKFYFHLLYFYGMQKKQIQAFQPSLQLRYDNYGNVSESTSQ